MLILPLLLVLLGRRAGAGRDADILGPPDKDTFGVGAFAVGTLGVGALGVCRGAEITGEERGRRRSEVEGEGEFKTLKHEKIKNTEETTLATNQSIMFS